MPVREARSRARRSSRRRRRPPRRLRRAARAVRRVLDVPRLPEAVTRDTRRRDARRRSLRRSRERGRKLAHSLAKRRQSLCRAPAAPPETREAPPPPRFQLHEPLPVERVRARDELPDEVLFDPEIGSERANGFAARDEPLGAVLDRVPVRSFGVELSAQPLGRSRTASRGHSPAIAETPPRARRDHRR